MKYLNHLSLGTSNTIHKNRLTSYGVGDMNYDAGMEGIQENQEYEIIFLSPQLAHRPDTISNVFYNTPTLGWLILIANNINDPFEGLNAGDRIRVPII